MVLTCCYVGFPSNLKLAVLIKMVLKKMQECDKSGRMINGSKYAAMKPVINELIARTFWSYFLIYPARKTKLFEDSRSFGGDQRCFSNTTSNLPLYQLVDLGHLYRKYKNRI